MFALFKRQDERSGYFARTMEPIDELCGIRTGLLRCLTRDEDREEQSGDSGILCVGMGNQWFPPEHQNHGPECIAAATPLLLRMNRRF